MTDKDLIPELHDILKLFHPDVLDHTFPENESKSYENHEPQTPTWQGVKHHHHPVDRATFFLHLADVQGASFARLDQKIKSSTHQAIKAPRDQRKYGLYVHKLWQPPKTGDSPHDFTLKKDNIIALLDYLKKDPSFAELCEGDY